MVELLAAALFGLVGGLIRAIVGLLKNYRVKKTTKFRPLYLTTTLIVAAVIGAATSLALTTNYLVNLVVGYAGIDILESVVKIIRRKN